MSYLLDTNTVINHLRGRRTITDRLRQLRDEDGLAISVISIAELYEGIFRAVNPESAEIVVTNVLRDITVLEVDTEVSKVFGRERARLRRLGTLMSDLDLLIASTAIHYGMPLLTSDTAFERLPNLNVIVP